MYDASKVERAVQQFGAADLNAPERLIAAHRAWLEALQRFRSAATELRREHGDVAVANFARHELNDIIAETQDAVAPLLRTYNAMLREPDQPDLG